MNKIVFLKMDGENQIEHRISGDTTWMEVTDRFVEFLRGCGHFVEPSDISDYLSEGTSTSISTPSVTGGTVTYTITPQPTSEYNFDGLTTVSSMWAKLNKYK